MKYCFFDTSAFTKLYAVEPGMRTVRDLLRSAKARPGWTRLVVCDLTLPEAFSALTHIQSGREAAAKGLSAIALQQILPRIRLQFGADSPFIVVPSTGCMELAADLVERHRLRGADSVQLAAALRASAMASGDDSFFFVSDDVAQCRAADAEGLEVLRSAA
ncbi:type II toxin-antitoxin system VapC family toxin [Longimicrobium sp.]|uniref:type II toxin-antitoxin system VapC family toxin n=1 Tax=Longimicrobium sp. TaxID=2029185 RepID=UPI002E33DF6F|nr:type II toxin-antitoxin system VapC family toxin [Longimicrobium sp.]HEX6039802.1 type II toxin-antitoxin system VapC family toxin [Longimicrobium sp.]